MAGQNGGGSGKEVMCDTGYVYLELKFHCMKTACDGFS